MKGFDPKFKDFPDYILGITHEIWEERQIQTLNHYYAANIPVRAPGGVVIGNQRVIDATEATLAEFPDRQLLGEDVIWSGDDEEGFLSSHRILSTATHLGDGAFGDASGTKLVYRVIADCAALENTIYDEWIVRDTGAIVAQLGTNPRQFAAQQIHDEGGPDRCIPPLTPATDAPPAYTGRGNEHQAGHRYTGILSDLMAGKRASIEDSYDRAVQLELPRGRTAHGWAAVGEFWSELRSVFPGATFSVDHQIGRSDSELPTRAALRWSLHGIHEGNGMFGQASGAEVYVMGLSHAEFGPRGLRREFVLIDEVAIWKQILLGAA